MKLDIKIHAPVGVRKTWHYVVQRADGLWVCRSKDYRALESAIKTLRSSITNCRKDKYVKLVDDSSTMAHFEIKSANGLIVFTSTATDLATRDETLAELQAFARSDEPKTFLYRGKERTL